MKPPRRATLPSKLAAVAVFLAAACNGATNSGGLRYGPTAAGDDAGSGGDSTVPSGGGGAQGGSAQGGSGGGAGAGANGGTSRDGEAAGGSTSDGGSPLLDGAKADAPAVACTNSDNTIVTINETGLIYPQCNAWGIQGAWYCYSDGIGTSDCVMGAVPYSASGSGMCISGTTASGTTAYGAGIGFGLNSTTGATPVKSPIADTSIIGFEITLSGGTYGSGGSVINVNMTTAAAAGTYPLVTVPGVAPNSTVTYDVFIKDALEPFVPNSPTAKPGGIYDLQVAIPQGPPNVQYDYCVTEVKPITATVAPAGACGSTVAYGPAFCNQLQEYLEEVGNFAVQNDTFSGSTGQLCIQAMRGGATCSGFVATFNGFNSTVQYTPGAFPSLVYGWQAGNFYGGYGGGTTVATLTADTTVSTDWSFSVGSGVSTYDAAYDIWFAPAAAPDTANGGLELMVWLQYTGVNPAGSNADAPIATVNSTVTGGTMPFGVHTATVSSGGSSWTYLAYLASTQTSSVSGLNLKPFLADAVQNRGLGSAWYLLGIQAGFEVYSATGSITVNSFDVNIQ
jgi:hypothetical protein